MSFAAININIGGSPWNTGWDPNSGSADFNYNVTDDSSAPMDQVSYTCYNYVNGVHISVNRFVQTNAQALNQRFTANIPLCTNHIFVVCKNSLENEGRTGLVTIYKTNGYCPRQ